MLGAVAGASSLDSIVYGANPTLPAAFVVPLSWSSQPNTLAGGALKQMSTEEFGVVVVVAAGDLRGQTGANTIPGIRMALWKALLNWRVDTVYANQGIYYDSDEQLQADTGRVFWLFKFALTLQISHLDGYVPTYNDQVSIIVSTPENSELLNIS